MFQAAVMESQHGQYAVKNTAVLWLAIELYHVVAIESSGYVQAELHVVVIKEHVLLMIYITGRSIT